MKINIGEFLTKRSFLTPDREGLVCEKVRRTYKELNERANRLANAMKTLGVGLRRPGGSAGPERTGVL